jgi:uncharacterized protein YbjT (DUF2867 family)
VTVMTRHPHQRSDDVREVYGDVSDAASVSAAMAGIDAAYYLVHTLDRKDFVERDRDGATCFGRQAAESGLERIVYLGGLGADGDDLSPHLRSRREVERILSQLVPTIALRAGIVVGDGSVSWEILCQLVQRLPVMVTPRWVQTTTQPIALSDVVAYLLAALRPEVGEDHYDVGGPQPSTYRQMLEIVAAEMGRSLLIVPVPLLSPRLSSQWLRLVTDVDVQTARSLVDSMTNEVVVHERRLEHLSGHAPMTFRDAARIALRERSTRTQREAHPDAVADADVPA